MIRASVIRMMVCWPAVAGLAGLAVLLVSGGAARGQSVPDGPAVISRDGLTDPSRLYPGINATNVADVAAALGFGTRTLKIEERHPTVILEDGGGLRLVAEPMVCDDDADGANGANGTNCQALLLYAYFGGSGAMRDAMLKAANRYNEVQFFGRAHITSNSDAVVSRIVIGEHGITRGNLAAELFTMRIAVYNYARLPDVRNSALGQASLAVAPGAAVSLAEKKFVPGVRPGIFGGGVPEARSFEADAADGAALVNRWRRLGLYADFRTDLEAMTERLGLDPVSSPAD